MAASDTSASSTPAIRPSDRRVGATPGWPDQPGVTHDGDLYGRALLSRVAGRTDLGWQVRDADGRVRCLGAALDRWLGPCDAADRSVLSRCGGPTLDVGCGPGRLVAALREADHGTLGIDVSEVAVRLTRGRGGVAVRADVFAAVPGERGWGTVVLLDGNLGIGGDPQRLLARCAELMSSDGRLLVEVSPSGQGSGVGRRRLETDGEAGPWFPWATLDLVGLTAAATATAFRLVETWTVDGRTFAALAR